MNSRKQTDSRLLAAADRGDADAFHDFYLRYVDRVHGYHLRRCRNEDAAVDLVAETFAQAWYARGNFRDEAGGTAGPWLFGIARNVLLMSVHRGRLEDAARQRLGMLQRVDDDLTAPDETWLDGVDELLDALPADQRDALQLRIVEDLSYDRMADELSISPSNARVRVHRALNALRVRYPTSEEIR